MWHVNRIPVTDLILFIFIYVDNRDLILVTNMKVHSLIFVVLYVPGHPQLETLWWCVVADLT